MKLGLPTPYLCVVAALAGCSEGAPGMAAPDAGADAGTSPAEQPRIPWLSDGVPPIVIAPCRAGWREVRNGDVATCDAFPEAGPEACAEGSAHFPGGAGCEPVGSACPAGEWSDTLGTAGVLYVRAGAAPGGDGTRAAPFATVGDAMSAASVGNVVALSRGRWDEIIRMRQGVTLQGACAAETVLTSSVASELASVVNVGVRGATLRDVRIEGALRVGVGVSGAGADLRIEGVIVAGNQVAGVTVEFGAHLSAVGLVARDARARSSDRRTGYGLLAATGASVEVARGIFERNREYAVVAFEPGTILRLEDVVVRDTESGQSDLGRGYGLIAQSGASVEVVGGLFERNRSVAIAAADAATSVRLEHVVVRDTRSRESDATLGMGLSVQDGASAEVVRGLFERNSERAVDGQRAASVRLEDVVVRDTLSQSRDQAAGYGVSVQSGSTLDVVRGLLERNRSFALAGTGTDTSVRLEDVTLRDTQSRESDLNFGRGLVVQVGASAAVLRGLFERNRDVSIFAGGTGSSLTLEDVVVRDTQSRESGLDFGRGLDVQNDARTVLLRGVFERNRNVAVYCSAADLQLDQVVVRDTLASECAEACAASSGGSAVGSYSGATLSMSHFSVERAAVCGVQVAFDAGLDLSDGDVRESMIGACVQVPDYAFSRLSARVSYVDNGTNIAATDLPVPEASAPIGAP